MCLCIMHDASTAVLLDLRRRFKAVVDVLRAVIRDGLFWLGLLSPQFSGMGSFGLGRVSYHYSGF